MGKEIWLAAGLRTPFTKIDAGLAARDEVGLGVPVVQAMAGQLRPEQRIDFALWGSVIPNLVYSNVGREIWFDAKLDATVPAATSVMACGSSIVAVFQAAGLIAAGASELALVGGSESMSHVQVGLTQPLSDWLREVQGARDWRQRLQRARSLPVSNVGLYVPRIVNRTTGKSMGEHCEEMAKTWGIGRTEQDELALESHRRAVAAQERGFFDDVIPIGGVERDGIPRRDTSMEKLAHLPPAFDRTSGKGTLTAGNSSPLTDGAAGIWVGTDAGLSRLQSAPARAKLIDFEMAAVDIQREGLLMAPAYAIPRLVARRQMTYSDVGLYEIHEAFSAQVLCHLAALEQREFVRERAGVDADLGKFPRDRINPNGGSVALGHPFGATGARILSQAVKELAKGARAIVSVCIDGGLGCVALLEGA